MPKAISNLKIASACLSVKLSVLKQNNEHMSIYFKRLNGITISHIILVTNVLCVYVPTHGATHDIPRSGQTFSKDRSPDLVTDNVHVGIFILKKDEMSVE